MQPLAGDDKQAIVNPTMVVEVTSDSTEKYDRGAKLEQYKLVESIQAIWIVSHAEPRVTVFDRHKRAWKTAERRRGAQRVLPSPALTVDVDEIYRVLDER